jgi:glutamyl/glutaminyl-tRNA synthetase
LQQLQTIDAVYLCACTRKEIADSALSGIEGQIYPGTCRNGVLEGREGRAWRVRMDTPFPAPSPGGRRELDSLSHRGNQRLSCDLLQLSRMAITSHLPRTLGLSGMANSHISCFIQRVREGGVVEFNDTLQGVFTQHLETEIGDFVIKRADGLFAYQLAVVADDAFQNITHVVRGCDLLTSTPRQIFLQRLLGLTTPAYMHLPVAVNAQGEKLSKQTLAAPVDISSISHTLLHALNFLNQATPTKLAACKPTEILGWAIAHWDKEKLKGIKQITVD